MSKCVDKPDVTLVTQYLKQLQDLCCEKFETLDSGASFFEDRWQYKSGGGGITRVIENGDLFEKGGVNFSHIVGDRLPDAASPLDRGRPAR